jgi:antitoxin component of MazEF toxin-antitoxin module
MAFPPTSNINAGYIATGTLPATIAWGTDGTLPNLAYIVKSVKATDVAEYIYIENGTGLRTKRIGLIQGREVEITVEDDLAISPPVKGANVNLLDPLNNFASHNFVVLDNNYNAARKQNGERIIRAVYDTMIEGGGTIPAA